MAVSELPGHPSAVWTVRGGGGEPYDRYIIVGFTNATLVLSIGETVEEVTHRSIERRRARNDRAPNGPILASRHRDQSSDDAH